MYNWFSCNRNNGFGIVKVCGRRREPRPAIGTIIFIFDLYYFKILYSKLEVQTFNFKITTPVLNPPSPLDVSDNSCTSIQSAFVFSDNQLRNPFSVLDYKRFIG
jgi:hypothetical protein